MRSIHFAKKLMIALSVGVTAILASQASAQGLYGGGSSSSSEYIRQVLNCYNTTTIVGDIGTPLLNPACTVAQPGAVEGLFAVVGSGRGQQAYFTDDPTQLVNGGTQAPGGGQGLPSVPPLYIDGASGSLFNTYPYPELDFTASEAPLPAGGASMLTAVSFSYDMSSSDFPWATANSLGVLTITNPDVTAVSSAAYNATAYGQPIQLPALGLPVAIAVNTSGLTVRSANRHSAVSTDPGNAIELDIAQVCAIFSGTVTDWSSTQSIPNLRSIGGADTHGFEAFSATNVNSLGASVAYATTSLPIRVIYQSNSGDSFIITNYLKSTCTQLDNGSNGYGAIFGASNLPSLNFSNLIANIQAQASLGLAVSTANFTGVTGTLQVAQGVSNAVNDPSKGGNIGYVSNDFTAADSRTVTGSVTPTAPWSASIQNEQQRTSGVNLPTTGANLFPAPTPANATTAYAALTGAGISAPGAGAAYDDWNVYAKTYPVGTAHNLAGKSILGVPNTAGAYPLVGTIFFEVYGCYKPAKFSKIMAFLNWYYNSATVVPGIEVSTVLANNGLAPPGSAWAQAILSNYLNTTSITAIGAGGTGICAGIPGA